MSISKRRFIVRVARECTECADIEVEAASAEEANERALKVIYEMDDVVWEASDVIPTSSELYLPDPDSTEEVED